MDDIICTICARGGSKGVKNKNLRILSGKPLIVYTIEQAINSRLFNHVVVSTDSDDIIAISREAGAEILFKRPAHLSSDTAGKLDVIRHAHKEVEKYYNCTFAYHVDLDATSPLRKISDIINAYQQFIRDDNDILISGMLARRSPYFNLVELDAKGNVVLSKQLDHKILRRQDSPKCFDLNASIYIWKSRALFENDSIFSRNTGLYVMPEERSYDIDSETDFMIVEMLMGYVL